MLGAARPVRARHRGMAWDRAHSGRIDTSGERRRPQGDPVERAACSEPDRRSTIGNKNMLRGFTDQARDMEPSDRRRLELVAGSQQVAGTVPQLPRLQQFRCGGVRTARRSKFSCCCPRAGHPSGYRPRTSRTVTPPTHGPPSNTAGPSASPRPAAAPFPSACPRLGRSAARPAESDPSQADQGCAGWLPALNGTRAAIRQRRLEPGRRSGRSARGGQLV